MIERESEIKELYELKHRKDNEKHTHYDYENNLVNRMLSKYVYRNDTMNIMINQYLKKQWIWLIESVLPIRNIFNYTVGKYYNKHDN
jgi:hypothetical protein